MIKWEIQKNYSEVLHRLQEENSRLRDENFNLKKRLEYIELLAKGLLHNDIINSLFRKEALR